MESTKLTKKKTTKTNTKTTKPVKKEKTRKQIQMELRKKADDILVEITNISYMQSVYVNKIGDEYFDLLTGESTTLTLSELEEVVRQCKGYFTSYSIIVTDVISNEVTVDDVMKYLALDNVFKKIDDPNRDFVEEILEMDDDDFEEVIEVYKNQKDILRNISARGVYMTNSDDYDYELSRKKNKILAEQFNRKTLFDSDIE